jgi:hypothetical protein
MMLRFPDNLTISAQDMEILRWFYIERNSHNQIAQWLHRSPKWVEVRIRILREALAMNGVQLPVANHRRPKLSPNLPETAVA